jgi:hypothetical protein
LGLVRIIGFNLHHFGAVFIHLCKSKQEIFSLWLKSR